MKCAKVMTQVTIIHIKNAIVTTGKSSYDVLYNMYNDSFECHCANLIPKVCNIIITPTHSQSYLHIHTPAGTHTHTLSFV